MQLFVLGPDSTHSTHAETHLAAVEDTKTKETGFIDYMKKLSLLAKWYVQYL
jgi:hypothetical protein